MKQNMEDTMRRKKFNVTLITAIIIMAILVTPVRANDDVNDGTVALGNILGSAVSTLLKGIIQGKVKNIGDAGKMLLFGGAAGYGFYSAKNMMAKGNPFAGVMMANLSASISENVSSGENPLAYVGYTLGPARIRFATPLAKEKKGLINVHVSAKEIVNLAYAFANSDRINFKYGLFTFESDTALKNGAIGWVKGVFATTLTGTPDYVLHHELVHVVQNLQLSSVSMYEPFMNRSTGPNSNKLFHFEGIKLDLFAFANDLASAAVSYESRWQEIEAHHFATAE
jgi:hypothetical protein